ncbi:glycerophosphodiester phosphodiesterase [Rhizomonospora bruguierae]|uniref:glycerophosphodiester phosphodiesterase n=1 Tax=Rhizomonospora bruguierae TaxID=1581705 RepID=UPI001BCB7062|nr:glycerophosphodiester phosphodiesterase family protein [Micromonospora sp. NBRC 107566]
MIAHRGHSAVAPENTLAAVAAARRAGADWIEVDVRCTADGVPVVIHDRTVDRTTAGEGSVAELTAASLGDLDAGSWFDPGFAGERVPTFAALCADLAAHGGRLLLELKPPMTDAQVAGVVAMAAAHGLAGRMVVQSFHPALVAATPPGLPRALLSEEPHEDPVRACAAVGAIAYNPDAAVVLADPEAPARWRAAGLATLVWTVNDPAQWQVLREAGVDGIITDRAGDLVAHLAALPGG